MIAFADRVAGKTTMFGLIERYYEPTSGEIRIGETLLKRYLWRRGEGRLAMFRRKVQ